MPTQTLYIESYCQPLGPEMQKMLDEHRASRLETGQYKAVRKDYGHGPVAFAVLQVCPSDDSLFEATEVFEIHDSLPADVAQHVCEQVARYLNTKLGPKAVKS